MEPQEVCLKLNTEFQKFVEINLRPGNLGENQSG